MPQKSCFIVIQISHVKHFLLHSCCCLLHSDIILKLKGNAERNRVVASDTRRPGFGSWYHQSLLSFYWLIMVCRKDEKEKRGRRWFIFGKINQYDWPRSRAMWPDWAIFKFLVTKFSFKSTKHLGGIFGLSWKTALLSKNNYGIFLEQPLEKFGPLLFQRLVTLVTWQPTNQNASFITSVQ